MRPGSENACDRNLSYRTYLRVDIALRFLINCSESQAVDLYEEVRLGFHGLHKRPSGPSGAGSL